MDSKAELYIRRAEKNIVLANAAFSLSTNADLKKILNLPSAITFFNNIISDSYYSIFYSAKAYLLSKGIKTFPPEEHKKTYLAFEANSQELDKELISIYNHECEKAEVLLEIFQLEKFKRGKFTYNVNANANLPFAEESINNAKKFVSMIKAIIEKEEE